MLEKGPAGPVTDEMRLQLSERIRRNELFAFVEIDADALNAAAELSPCCGLVAVAAEVGREKRETTEAAIEGRGLEKTAPVRIHMESITYNEVGRWLMQSINQAAIALRLHDARLDPAAVAAAISPVEIAEVGLYSRNTQGQIQKANEASRGVSFFLPFGLMMLMFMSVMVVAQPMLTSVIEEKQQRIAEMLVGLRQSRFRS